MVCFISSSHDGRVTHIFEGLGAGGQVDSQVSGGTSLQLHFAYHRIDECKRKLGLVCHLRFHSILCWSDPQQTRKPFDAFARIVWIFSLYWVLSSNGNPSDCWGVCHRCLGNPWYCVLVWSDMGNRNANYFPQVSAQACYGQHMVLWSLPIPPSRAKASIYLFAGPYSIWDQ